MPSNRSAQSRLLRVAVRLSEWSEWDRQVFRGIRRFAHEQPNWQLFPRVRSDDFSRPAKGRSDWDGIITSVLDEVSLWRKLLRRSPTRIVSITSSAPRGLEGIPAVGIDDSKISRVAGKHLLAGGFRRFAYYRASAGRVDRRAAAIKAFAEAEGLPCEVYTEKLQDAEPIPVAALTRWVGRLEKPVGILAWNMNLATLIVEACRRARVAVPEEAAVIAWDDDDVIAESVEPSITGVVLPTGQLGYEAAHLLDRLLRGERAPGKPILLEPSGLIHVRQSSDVSHLEDRDVYLAQQYIREHAHESFKVGNVIAALRTSRRKLEQDFVRVTGQTLHEAMLHAHFDRAKQFLLETDWPLDRVVDRAGFGSKRRFHAVFASRERMTPLEYRARFRGP